MVFKRRNKMPWAERLRESLSPRKGWWRGLAYMGHRIKRIPDTPHRIALGIACGVFIGFSPFFGIHMLAAIGIAYLIGANPLAAAIGTWMNNPVTFPFIVAGALNLGRILTGRDRFRGPADSIAADFEKAMHSIWGIMRGWFGHGNHFQHEGMRPFFFDVFLPYVVGAAALGLVAGSIMYVIVRPLIAAFQHRRSEKLKERQRKHQEDEQSKADTAS